MPRTNLNVKRRPDGKRVYTAAITRPIPISVNDVYIIADETTRLDKLALQYYNNSSYWWIIAKANGIGFGYSVDIGQQLRIPTRIESVI